MEPIATKKSKATDAWKKCSENPHVALAIGRMFWQEKQIEKARGWFERAVLLDADLGDAWAYYYAFEETLSQDKLESLRSRCIRADPHHGPLWVGVAKDITIIRSLTTEEILVSLSRKIREMIQ